MKYGEKLVSVRRWRRNSELVYGFRCDPVPFTGNSRAYGKKAFYAWHKKPRTTQERRLSFAYKKYVRGKRKAHYLPNTWDDYLRSDCRTRNSWKKRRKNQWK